MDVMKLSEISGEIANAFKEGELMEVHLDGHGISEMGVMWRGHHIFLSWYSPTTPRHLSIDGNRFFPKGRNSKVIFRAAIERANELTDEFLARL